MFRETIKPWDSITVPSMACPTGWLVDKDLAPGRYVPKGVEVVEPGLVGVTITATDFEYGHNGDKTVNCLGRSVRLRRGHPDQRRDQQDRRADPGGQPACGSHRRRLRCLGSQQR
jgi:hypothetical protein